MWAGISLILYHDIIFRLLPFAFRPLKICWIDCNNLPWASDSFLSLPSSSCRFVNLSSWLILFCQLLITSSMEPCVFCVSSLTCAVHVSGADSLSATILDNLCDLTDLASKGNSGWVSGCDGACVGDDDCSVEKCVDSARVDEEACAVDRTRKGWDTGGRFQALLDVALVFGWHVNGVRMSRGHVGVCDLDFGPELEIFEGTGNESWLAVKTKDQEKKLWPSVDESLNRAVCGVWVRACEWASCWVMEGDDSERKGFKCTCFVLLLSFLLSLNQTCFSSHQVHQAYPTSHHLPCTSLQNCCSFLDLLSSLWNSQLLQLVRFVQQPMCGKAPGIYLVALLMCCLLCYN